MREASRRFRECHRISRRWYCCNDQAPWRHRWGSCWGWEGSAL